MNYSCPKIENSFYMFSALFKYQSENTTLLAQAVIYIIFRKLFKIGHHRSEIFEKCE